jgi:hypothetical protein
MFTVMTQRRNAMEGQGWVDKTKDALTPFETENLLNYFQSHSLLENPWIIGAFLILLIIGIVKRSKFVLLSLFTLVSLLLLIRYTFPPAGQELTLSTLVPFLAGGAVIGGVIIYFTLIKSD